MTRIYLLLSLISGLFTPINFSLADESISALPPNIFYIKIHNGFKGLFAHNNVYAEYTFKGSEIKIQDANHIWLKPGLGMMITFADKREFGATKDLLNDHIQWEIDYWRKNTSNVESLTRNDLRGVRTDIKVTELNLFNEGKQTKIYTIGLASEEGVFVLAVSPVEKNIDPLIKNIVASFRLVKKKLDPEELKRLSIEQEKPETIRNNKELDRK